MKKSMLSILLLACCFVLNAQSQTLRGTVVDVLRDPLPGVNVVVKGTTMGTITGLDGTFVLNVNGDEAKTLVFTSVGFVAQEIPIQGKSNFEVILQEDNALLEELVVVGYGVQKKALVTGANLNVKGESVVEQRSASIMEALQGTAPGVSITRNNGAPGAGTKVTIRGMGTIGNANPLFIVDGIAVGNIDYLSPADIESVNILKDAASAAIYGARAANGVVLVTTKQAEKGAKTRVNYDAYYGMQNIYKLPTPLNAQEYMYIMDERRVNDGLTPYNWENMIVNGNTNLNNQYGGDVGTKYGQHVWDKIQSGWEGTNWVKEIVKQDAMVQQHALNITGTSADFKYSAGLSYFEQEGIVGNHVTGAGYKRLTARYNTELVLFKHNNRNIITLGENFTFSNTTNKQVANGNIYWNDFHDAIVANPLTPLRYENETLNRWTNGYAPTLEGISNHQHNPVGKMYYRNNYSWGKSNNITANVYAVIEPIQNLKIKSAYGLTTWFGHNRSWTPFYRLGSMYSNTTDAVSQSTYQSTSHTWTNTISYDKSIENHKFSVLVGSEMLKNVVSISLNGSQKNTLFGLPEFAYLSNTKKLSNPDDISLSGSDWAAQGGGLMSYMSRFSYNYNEKYMLDFTMRADGSSNFSKGNRWGYFPSLAAGWNISEEAFAQDLDWLSFAKLRASWGQNGNHSIPAFTYLSEIAVLNRAYYFGDNKITSANGSQPYRVPNPNIKWETSEQLNIGFDTRFVQSKLGLTFDWYKKTTKDWLVEAPVLGTFGLLAPYINGGDVVNTGFEVMITWNDKIGDFKYGINLSAARNKNEVVKLANAEGIIVGEADVLAQGTSYVSRVEVGKPIGYFYGYQTNGILQNQTDVDNYVTKNGDPIVIGTERDTPRRPGDVHFVDRNGDGVIDDADKTMIGKPMPDVELGLQLNAEYKGFFVNTTLAGKFGMQVMQSYRTYIDQRENFTTEIFDRWHGEGTSNRIPRLSNGSTANFNLMSDMYVHDADYLRISNLTFGFKFDELLRNFKIINAATLSVSVNNLYTFTKYSGMNPEVGYGGNWKSGAAIGWASGIDLGLYPLPRTVMIGLNVTF